MDDYRASGRARFAGGVCAVHGPGPDGEPCARFAHLRTDGRGKHRSAVRGFLAGVKGVVKPFVLVGVVVGGGWFLVHSLPGVLRFGGLGDSGVHSPAPTPSQGRAEGLPLDGSNCGGADSGIVGGCVDATDWASVI